MNKQIIVILESTDGCGKSTIKKALEKKSNWKYIVLDRFVGSDIVYDKIYNRKNRDYLLLKLEQELSLIADVYLIYLDCDLKEQIKRLKEKKEDKKIVNKIRKSKELFEKYLEKTYLDFITINTTITTPEQASDKIIEFINKGGEI